MSTYDFFQYKYEPLSFNIHKHVLENHLGVIRFIMANRLRVTCKSLDKCWQSMLYFRNYVKLPYRNRFKMFTLTQKEKPGDLID